MKTTFKLMSFLILSVIIFACSDDDNPTDNPEETGLKEVRILNKLNASDIKRNCQAILLNAGMPAEKVEAFVAKFKYDIELAMVSYEIKDPLGNNRILSGVVSYPILHEQEKDKKLHIYSDVHGTIGFNTDAPSQDMCAQQRNFLMHISSHENGYIAVFPDYFGYGTDKDNMHYYEHMRTLASASRGLIDLVPEYAKQKSLQVNTDRLYIAGYSEGGFAAMSTLKDYSETVSRFKNFTTIAGAGAYDTKQTLLNVFDKKTGTPEYVGTYAWAMMVYNKVYNINRDLNELFISDYIPVLKKHEGKNSIYESLEDLPSIPSDIFTSGFIKGIKDGSDNTFIKALDDNNVSDFDAKGEIYLVHGDKDPWIPSFNADLAYERLKARGVNIEKQIVEGGTHNDKTPLYFTMKIIEVLNK